MEIPVDGFENDIQLEPSASAGATGIVRPAGAYDEPVFTDVVLPAGTWTQVATRDIQRGLIGILRTGGVTTMQVRSGGQSVAVPFFVGTDETVFSLRYVDFLTLVTGDWFARSVAGETVTVFTIRLID